jgi:hypothetical protein
MRSMGESGNNMQSQKPRISKLAKWCFGLAILSVSIVIYLFFAERVSHFPNVPEWVFFLATYNCLALVISWLASVFLGIFSIFVIKRGKGKLRGMEFAIGGIAINATIAVVIIGVGVMIVRPAIHQVICGMNLSGLGKALAIYANDYDGKYPTANKWCDLLIQLGIVTEKQFECRRNKEEKCSYAVNPNAEPNSPPYVVLLFETKGGWNKFGGPELLTFGNHKGKGCNVLFKNGRVKFVKKRDLGKLKWKFKEADSRQDIHDAVWQGDFDRVQSMLAQRPESVHEKNIFNWRPLHTAALAGHRNIVKLLLAKGAGEHADDRGETPMHIAAREGHEDIIKLFLGAGMDPNPRDQAAITPLHLAAMNGHKEVVEFLISKGAEVNARDDTRMTPLWYVHEEVHKEIADLLRRHGGVK